MRAAPLFAAVLFIATATAGPTGFEGNGPHWVIADVVTGQGGRVDVGLVFSGPANLLVVGWNDEGLYGGTDENGVDAAVRADLRSPIADGSLVVFEGFGGTTSDALPFVEAGRYRALFIFAGDVTNWVLTPSEGIDQIELVAQGVPRTIGTDDWSGPAYARLTAGPTVEAAVTRTMTFDVEDTLTGWFFQGGQLSPGAGSMRLHLPDGVDRDCYPPGYFVSPCYFPNADYPLGGPPGTYTAHYTGAIASEADTPGFVVADVPLWDFP